jgi:hypothetical protein
MAVTKRPEVAVVQESKKPATAVAVAQEPKKPAAAVAVVQEPEMIVAKKSKAAVAKKPEALALPYDFLRHFR